MRNRIDINQKRWARSAPEQIAGLPAPVWDAAVRRLRSCLAGEYRITRELGRGGQAAVFLADELALGRKVAIKMLAPGSFADPGAIARFRREAQTIANLKHLHIVTIFSVREVDGLHFFVMQFVEGRSLAAIIAERGPLPLTATRAVAFQVGSALQYAHRRNVIHHDIKPGNVLFDEDGNAILTDFGIAKDLSSPASKSGEPPMGTPAYMSPEQCAQQAVTWSSDQYSFGILLYEMLTGHVPFEGPGAAVMQAHTDREAPPIRASRADCPVEMEWAVMRMLAKQPKDRWPSLADALSALEASPLSREDPIREELCRLALEAEPQPDAPGGEMHGDTIPVWSRLPGPTPPVHAPDLMARVTQEVVGHPIRRPNARRRLFSPGVPGLRRRLFSLGAPALLIAVLAWALVPGDDATAEGESRIAPAALFGPAAATAISDQGYAIGTPLTDDFSTSAAGVRAEARDGRLRLIDGAFASSPDSWSVDTRDFAAHFDMQHEGGNPERYGGFLLRRGVTGDGRSRAYFVMIRAGERPGFGVLFNNGGGYEDVIARRAIPADGQGSASVDLVVIGDTLTVFLNNTHVGSALLTHNDGGGFGLFAEPELRLSFDNLRVAPLRRGGA